MYTIFPSPYLLSLCCRRQSKSTSYRHSSPARPTPPPPTKQAPPAPTQAIPPPVQYQKSHETVQYRPNVAPRTKEKGEWVAGRE